MTGQVSVSAFSRAVKRDDEARLWGSGRLVIVEMLAKAGCVSEVDRMWEPWNVSGRWKQEDTGELTTRPVAPMMMMLAMLDHGADRLVARGILLGSLGGLSFAKLRPLTVLAQVSNTNHGVFQLHALGRAEGIPR